LHYTVAHRSALYCIRYTTLHHIAVYDITLHDITLSYRTLLTFDHIRSNHILISYFMTLHGTISHSLDQ